MPVTAAPGHCPNCERQAELSTVRLAAAEALERAAKSPRVLLAMIEEMAAYLRSEDRPAEWQWFGGHLLHVVEAIHDVGRVVAGTLPAGDEMPAVKAVKASRRGPRGATKRDLKTAKILLDYLAMERRLKRALADLAVERERRRAGDARCAEVHS